MSHLGYECLHVPVQAARLRVFGLPLWVLPLIAAAAAWKIAGPWVILAPVLVVILGVGTAVVVAVLRSGPTAPAATAAGTTSGGPVDVLTGAPVVVLSGIGAVPCIGCGTGPATAVLEVSGYRIPVCGTCQATAHARIADLVAAQLAGQHLPRALH